MEPPQLEQWIEPQIEPWMRGPIAGVHPITSPFLYSMIQVREDVARWTAGLTTVQLWERPLDVGPAGFHIRHIGGSVERLATYLKGASLTAEQLDELKRESEPGASLDQLLIRLEDQFLYAEAIVKSLDPRTWTDPRTVGRKALPTTVGGLVHHMAEHSQRHLGELIVTVKLLRGLNR